jgi:hypothetical protein
MKRVYIFILALSLFSCRLQDVAQEDKKQITDLSNQLQQQQVYYDNLLAQKDSVIWLQQDTLNRWRKYAPANY